MLLNAYYLVNRGLSRSEKFFDGKVDYDQGMPAQYNPLVYIANKGHKIDIVYPGKKDTLERYMEKYYFIKF